MKSDSCCNSSEQVRITVEKSVYLVIIESGFTNVPNESMLRFQIAG